LKREIVPQFDNVRDAKGDLLKDARPPASPRKSGSPSRVKLFIKVFIKASGSSASGIITPRDRGRPNAVGQEDEIIGPYKGL
jgi:hypothetical protein